MNKWIAIPIISVLAVGLIATGVFYLQETNKLQQETNKLKDAQTEIATLGTELADSEAEVSALEGDISALETELADSEARVATLEAELDQANSAAQALQSLNLTLSEELEKMKNPRHFESLEELEAWLEQDDTDTRIRWASASPNERAFILQVRALRDGYLLPAWFEDWFGDGLIDYVGNLAYIGVEIYYVWAVDDSVVLYAFDVLPVPSHPLPSE